MTDQKARIKALDPHKSFVVQAPAGSGKTGLLIQRLLTLLAMVERPEQILALTFTRKAAGEMRERILQSLRQAAAEDPVEDHYAQNIRDLARAVLRQDEAFGWDLLQNPSRLQVMTIDAFCHRLARQLPLLSGFGSQPELSERADELYREAATVALDTLFASTPKSSRPGIERLLLHYDNRLERLQAMLAEMLSRRDQWLPATLAHREDPEFFRHRICETLAHMAIELMQNIQERLPVGAQETLLELVHFALPNLEKNSPETTLACWRETNEWPQISVSELPRWQSLARWLMKQDASELRASVDVRQGFPPKTPEKQRMLDLLSAMAEVEGLEEHLGALANLPDGTYFGHAQGELLDALMQILLHAAACLQQVFAALGRVDFTEVGLRAIQALEQGGAPSELLLRLDYRLRHILIDEFQDTSIMQVRLLRLLTDGWSCEDGRTLFLVGDPMQSIYRFRKAEVGLFIRASRNELGLPVLLEPLVLTRNFRSAPAVVNWVNRCFSRVFPEVDEPVEGAVRFRSSEVAAEGSSDARVCLHLQLCGEGSRFDSAIEAKHIADLIMARSGRRIGVLVRSRSHLSDLMQELAVRRIRCRAVDVLRLEERPEIRLLEALTRALLHPADDVAWLALLRSPFCGLEIETLNRLLSERGDTPVWTCLKQMPLDPAAATRVAHVCRALAPVLESVGRIPVAKLTRLAWLRLGAPAWFDEEAQANAAVYFDLLDELDHGGMIDLDRLRRTLAGRYSSPPVSTEAQVELLTMHAAKGLQWDVVIIPGLGRTPRSGDRPLLAYTEVSLAESEAALFAMCPGSRQKDALYELVQRIEKRKDAYETTRLMYVAATRAENELHLFGHVSAGKGSPAKGTLLSLIWESMQSCHGAELQVYQVDTTDSQAPSAFRPCRLAEIPEPILPPPILASGQINEHAAEFIWAGPEASPMGDALHAALARVAERGVERWNAEDHRAAMNQMRRLLLSRGLAGKLLDDVLARCRQGLDKTLKSSRGRWILSGRHRDAHAEWGLSSSTHGHVRLDRCFVDEKDLRWIIDYKTATHEGADLDGFLEAESSRHRPQLLRYAQLVRQVDPEHEIRLALYFPMLDAWKEISA